MKRYDIILRNCGEVGWLGILVDGYGDEVYRTGKHHTSDNIALTSVKTWMDDQNGWMTIKKRLQR